MSSTIDLKGYWQKALFSVSKLNLSRKWKRFLAHRRENDPRKTIRLAVVGARSSGKTFFLRDIIDALNRKGAAYYPLERDGFCYKGFDTFLRSQSRTDVYVCRRSDHYGQNVSIGRKDYDFDFLNIPGEIFRTEDNIRSYIEIRDQLNSKRKLFAVTTYITEGSDEERLIIEPRKGSTIKDSDRKYQTSRGLNKSDFRDWGDIYGNLYEQGFKLKEGSQRSVSGKELLRNFFEYDTDSVIRSISDLIKSNQITFDSAKFEDTDIKKFFVFFQYCALATDVVLCDRIFVKVEDGTDELSFGTLTDNLSNFFNDKKLKKPHVYLAFRNVDFLLKTKEAAYKNLCNEVLKDVEHERKWNIIYSLFNYSILHKIFGYTIPESEFYAKMGIPGQNIKILPSGSLKPEDMENAFVDFNANGGIIHNARDLKNHIETRIGGRGQAFQRLLIQTGWTQKKEQAIVPHVYFTCTPITENFDIYENRIVLQIKDGQGNVIEERDVTGTQEQSKGTNSFEFYRGEGLGDKFSEQSSCACFGSYQLLMDILIQHGIFDKFEDGQLLRMLRDVRKD